MSFPARSALDQMDHAGGIPGEKFVQVVRDHRQRLVHIFIVEPAEVRRDEDVVHVPQRTVFGQRLLAENIERRSGDPPLPQRGHHRFFIDHAGAQVAVASLHDDVWPGTNALYFAEVQAQAPRTTGEFTWQVTSPGSDEGAPHAAGACPVALKVVAPPDHDVTVEAIDSANQTPIKGAHVLLHPYRALTDERGVAKVKVAKGRYTLVVSGFNYIGYESILDVTRDVTARAELAVEPEEEVDIR